MSYYSKLITTLLLLASVQAFAAENKVTAEDILAHHLDSIADAKTRAAMKSRVVEGTAAYRILVGGSGEANGKSVMVSDGDKFLIQLKVNTQQYNGEQFTTNGNKTFVAGTYQDKSRSEFGTFLRSEDLPLREGLLGGVLTTDWSLLDLSGRKAKLQFDGLKNVDGTQLYAVKYRPKKNTDMDVTLFFDPETYRHVLTIYTANVNVGLGQSGQADVLAAPPEVASNAKGGGFNPQDGADVNSARQQVTRYRVEERFSDFKTTDGVTLPSHYDLRFQEELPRGFTKTVDWNITTTRVLNNVTIDERNFTIH